MTTRSHRLPVHLLVRARGREHPDRVAVESGDRRWSYAELLAHADRLSAALGAGEAGRRVALCCDDSADLVAAILGVLGVRGVFVPLDSAAPEARRRAEVPEQRGVLVGDVHRGARRVRELQVLGVGVHRLDR